MKPHGRTVDRGQDPDAATNGVGQPLGGLPGGVERGDGLVEVGPDPYHRGPQIGQLHLHLGERLRIARAAGNRVRVGRSVARATAAAAQNPVGVNPTRAAAASTAANSASVNVAATR
jgi:hypothetical protein